MPPPALWGDVERLVSGKDKNNWPGAARGGSGPVVWCVLGGVLLSRTLAGAVPSALSGLASGFGMDTGRFPVAVTTETTEQAVRDDRSSLVRLYSVIRVAAYPHTLVVCVVGGWVGCGPYSGRFTLHYCAHPPTHTWCVVCGGVVVCVGLLVPVSSSNRCRSSTSGLSTQ